jgi:hypothetical protein
MIVRLSEIARLCAPSFTFIVNCWPDTLAELGGNAEDLAALSCALSSRTGLATQFRQMMRRGQESSVYWAVIEVSNTRPGAIYY